MAGTDENGITAADWRLACDELAFVAEYTDTEQQAKELLLDAPIVHAVRWCCDRVTVVEKRDYQANPPVETPLAAANLFFWHRDEHTRIAMDWPTSCPSRMGSVVRLGSDGRGHHYPIVDTRASSEWTAIRVRYHHGDVVNMLVARGYMSRPPKVTPRPSEVPSSASPPAKTKKPRVGSQEQWIAPVALEIFADDLPMLTAAELQSAIETRQKAGTLKTPLPPHWVANWDACKRFLQKRGKLRPD